MRKTPNNRKGYSWPKVLAAICATSASGGIATSALAQGDSLMLEEVVVTAQRREQSLKDVPVSVSVFDQQAMAKSNIREATDYLTITPNVSITEDGESGSRGFGISIRGIGNLSGEVISSNAFGFYIDEFNVSTVASGSINPQLADIARVEVLRGPQGTYFGRNSTGGAINLTTNAPDSELYGELSTFLENFNTYGVSAVVNVPLSDTVMFRTVASYEESDGYVENTFSEADNPFPEIGGTSDVTEDSGYEYFNIRTSVTVHINDALTFDGTLMFTSEDQGLDENVPTGVLDLDTLSFPIFANAADPCTTAENAAKECAVSLSAGFYDDNDDKTSKNAMEQNNKDLELYIARFTYETDNYLFKSITGYIETESIRDADVDGTALARQTRHQTRKADSFSQELRVHSNGWDDIEWTVGAIYAKDNFSRLSDVVADQNGALLQSDFEVGGPPPFFFYDIPFYGDTALFPAGVSARRFRQGLETESYAVFGDFTWHATDELSLTAGIRYSRDEVDQSFTDRLEGPTFLGAGRVQDDISGDSTTTDTSPRISVQYEFNDDINGYATFSRGYKRGGTQLNTPDEAVGLEASTEFDKEKLSNFEVGLKSTLFDGRVRLNLSAFYLDWEDLQVDTAETVASDDGTITVLFLTQNAASATSKGMEAEFTALVSESFTVGGGLGYMKAEFDDFKEAAIQGTVVDLSGKQLPRAPDLTANMYGEYYTDMMGGEGWVRLEWMYRDETRSDLEAVAAPELGLQEFPYLVPSYNVWNLRAGLAFENFEVNAYVENLLEEDYYTGTQENFGFSGFRVAPHPRVLGVSFKVWTN